MKQKSDHTGAPEDFRPGQPTGLRTIDDLRRLAGFLRGGVDFQPPPICRMMDEALLRTICNPTKEYRESCANKFSPEPVASYLGWMPSNWQPESARAMLARHLYDLLKEQTTPAPQRNAGLIFIAAVASYDAGKATYASQETPLGYLRYLLVKADSFHEAARMFSEKVRDGILIAGAKLHDGYDMFLEQMREALNTSFK